MLLPLTAWEILLQLSAGLLPEVHIVNSSRFSESSSSPVMHPQPGNKNLTSPLQEGADHLEDQALTKEGKKRRWGGMEESLSPAYCMQHRDQSPSPAKPGREAPWLGLHSAGHTCLRQQPASCSILNNSNRLPAGWQNSTPRFPS